LILVSAIDKKQSTDLKLQRQWYADELRWDAKLRSERLVKAFATVPREAFLGPGPWHIHGDRQLMRGYTKTSDADPRHLSHNVLVAIDVRRSLNNGHPSFLASLIDQLNMNDGETVYHVGCGTGYYSAIMAQMVGEDGRVVAVEVDKTLARRARRNLEGYRNVEVVNADGFAHNPGHVDAILVNAGVTHLSQVWLRELRAKGRLVVPLTTKEGRGRILKATQNKPNWHARFISHVGIYHCVGARNRSAENLLREAFAKGGAEKVRSLRLDEHERNRGCWLHGPGFCLSRRPS
jgi:protein-L-isoaspartate(D-aspartate) O-methyltransferase